jgi:hypothetical protein
VLAVDLGSWATLLDDLATAARQLAAGQPVELPAARASFQPWLAAHAGDPVTPASAPSAPRATAAMELAPAGTAALRAVIDRHRSGGDAVLLAALAGALAPGADMVELETADRRDPDLARVIGGCTAPLAVRLQPGGAALDRLDAIATAITGAARLPARADRPGVLVRYLGVLDPAEAVVAAPVPHPTIITAGLWRGALVITVDAGDAARADRLAAALRDELARAIHELGDAAPRAPRPTDFAHVELDAGELDDLLEDLS